MTDLVDREEIERIVGAQRNDVCHLARAVTEERMVYILHSGQCLTSGIDLRKCRYSRALDLGIDEAEWAQWQDTPVLLGINDEGYLYAVAPVTER